MVYALNQYHMSGKRPPRHADCYLRTGVEPRASHDHRSPDKEDSDPDYDDNDDEDDGEVSLLPFSHQVGGHSQIMLLDPGTLCKPLITRELNFYLNIPPQMQTFVPNYKGVMKVSKPDGAPVTQRYSPCFRSSAPEAAEFTHELQEGGTTLRVRLHRNSSFSEPTLGTAGNSSSPVHYVGDVWTPTNDRQCFLLLENVASHYRRPCILDLKMGTRQHGDDASADKQARHMARCAASTSATLGVRLCGMQVYQVDSCTFKAKDKYYGRRLDEAGFKRALGLFFHNGFQLRIDVIDKVVKRLRALRRAVEKQNTFRFYSSSLLITYEGCALEEEPEYLLSGSRSSSLCEEKTFLKTNTSRRALDDRSLHGTNSLQHKLCAQSKSVVYGSGNLHIHSEETMFPDSSDLCRLHAGLRDSCNAVPGVAGHYCQLCARNEVSNNLCQLHAASEHSSCSAMSTDSDDFHHCARSRHSSDLCRLHAVSMSSCSSVMSVDSGVELSEESKPESELSSDSHSFGDHPQQYKGKPNTKLTVTPSEFACVISHKQSQKEDWGSSRCYKEPSVDVRMIDFAHTTFGGQKGDSPVHRGPDEGYILGLNSLTRLLTEIRAEAGV